MLNYYLIHSLRSKIHARTVALPPEALKTVTTVVVILFRYSETGTTVVVILFEYSETVATVVVILFEYSETSTTVVVAISEVSGAFTTASQPFPSARKVPSAVSYSFRTALPIRLRLPTRHKDT